MALLTEEQSQALAGLTQKERIDVVLNVLIRHMEKSIRRKALSQALTIISESHTKEEAVGDLAREIDRV
jgi:hypothetical protein